MLLQIRPADLCQHGLVHSILLHYAEEFLHRFLPVLRHDCCYLSGKLRSYLAKHVQMGVDYGHE